ncbi:(d)CMP kinase [Psychrobacillus sp. INOP01]|uniref:uridine kinase family protein n=1 Tax=Psychrobacillus sp. INOP01 TaxID=2829187 RepID=UPI001BAA2B97|nr:(d)CMP kinase [Psychrobacillus sp. INOP01]QUG42583.1 (d)CMP kinase [Psychrobacillus sp. INOP01]
MESYDKLVHYIKQQLTIKETVIIAIDGRCGSGKSTFASTLANELNGQIVQMDDFFLPVQLRTKERLQQAGENIHYERFNEEVIIPITRGEDIALQSYDCTTDSFKELQKLPKKFLFIIEGTYSLYQKIRDIYDVKIFMTVDSSIQVTRIKERNGIESLGIFQQKWIPLEEKYFSEYSIENHCDVTIDTTNGEGIFRKGSKII